MAVACGECSTLLVGERGLQVFEGGQGLRIGGRYGKHRRVPEEVPGLMNVLAGSRVVMVAAGGHSAVVTSKGDVVLWGYGLFGQLGRGLGVREVSARPVKLGKELFGNQAVLMVACGHLHTMIVTEHGRLFAFGHGVEGRLGLGDTNDRDMPVEVGAAHFGGVRIAYVAAGTFHSGAVTSEGRVYTWGSNMHGALGHVGDATLLLVPREIVGSFEGRKVVMLAAGGCFTMVLTTDGALWACGRGFEGQLGVGDSLGRLRPARVGAGTAFENAGVLSVHCGGWHAMAISEDGGLWSWGRSHRAQLGHNDFYERLVPERVAAERFGGEVKIVAAACGEQVHSAAITEDGTVYTWGGGYYDPEEPEPSDSEEEYPGDGTHCPTGLGHEDLQDKLVPALVDCRHFHGTRIGRCLQFSRIHAVAFAMGTHGRLGGGVAEGSGGRRKSRRLEGRGPVDESKESAIMLLAGEPGLVKMVAEMCQDWPEGPAGASEGLLRLLGGGGQKRHEK